MTPGCIGALVVLISILLSITRLNELPVIEPIVTGLGVTARVPEITLKC